MEVIKDNEAERAFLGAALINPEIVGVSRLTEEAFVNIDHKDIWSGMKMLWLKQLNIDLITLGVGKDHARKMLLVELINACPTHLGWETYEERLLTLQMRRRTIVLAEQMVKAAIQGDDLAIPIAAEKLLSLSVKKSSSQSLADVVCDLYDDVQGRNELYTQGKIVHAGITTGLQKLDYVTGGLQAGELTIISGEPGLGKSILAMQIAKAAARERTVRIYSLEMPARQIVRRWVAADSGVSARQMKSGELDIEFWDKFTAGISKLSTLPITICDDSGTTTSDIRADLSRCANEGTGLIVIDYLTLLGDGAGMNEVERTAVVSSACKRLARDFNLSVILVHSMNKVGMRATRPTLADLRSSAQVAYDADLALMMTKGTSEFFPAVREERLENCRLLWLVKARDIPGGDNVFLLEKGDETPEFAEFIKTDAIGWSNQK